MLATYEQRVRRTHFDSLLNWETEKNSGDDRYPSSLSLDQQLYIVLV
jgi:hypothetical protein